MTAHKLRSMLYILPTMTLMWLDYDNLSLNTISRLVAGSTKSILFTSILNSVITNETLVLESIIHLNFKGLMHSLFVEAQLSILSKSRLIECKQESLFTLRLVASCISSAYSIRSQPKHPVDYLYTYRTTEAPLLIPGEHLYLY